MAKNKYGYLFKKLTYKELPGGGKKPEYITWPKGSDLEGMKMSFVWSYHNKVGPWGIGGEYGHVHPYGEVFLFTGLDYDNPNRMDAELELSIGEKAEQHVIASPSIVVIPAGVPHLPVNISDKPTSAVISRTDPNEQESVVLRPDLEPLAEEKIASLRAARMAVGST